MGFTEKPPMLTGDTRQDVSALRDFLFRLSGSLEQAAIAPAASVKMTKGPDGKPIPTAGNEGETEALRKNARELRSLILQNAKEVIHYADSKVEEYNSLYLAKSEFGEFEETLEARIETDARGVVESYDYDSMIEATKDTLQQFMTSIDGQIRRGIIENPMTHEMELGIAISQNLQFTGQVYHGDDADYYYLDSGQTFGLYTSTGWQFWINGYPRGWFSAVDGMLHVADITVENSLRIGGKWQLKLSGEMLEFKYLEE